MGVLFKRLVEDTDDNEPLLLREAFSELLKSRYRPVVGSRLQKLPISSMTPTVRTGACTARDILETFQRA